MRLTHMLMTTAWLVLPALAVAQQASPYRAHDSARPRPAVIQPGTDNSPPSDAVVLFDGDDLEQWQAPDGTKPQWVLDRGTMHPTPESGPLQTKARFGDVQLHLEWSAPSPPQGNSQGRGNSGVYLMTKYEVQILDCFDNETYADGQAAAIYGQNPPLVNACRPPGQWQTYDIIFRRPRFAADGSLIKPAIMTVFHNGVLVQDHFELWGPTNWLKYDEYQPHENTLPLSLQDHGNPVRFRNIWLRELPETLTYKTLGEATPKLTLTDEQLGRLTGDYMIDGNRVYTLSNNNGVLELGFWGRTFELVPQSETNFHFKRTDAEVDFDINGDKATGITVTITGSVSRARKE